MSVTARVKIDQNAIESIGLAEAKKKALAVIQRAYQIADATVPVVSGALKSSGAVKQSKSSVDVEYSESYAVIVHERPGRGQKFLSNALDAASAELGVKGSS